MNVFHIIREVNRLDVLYCLTFYFCVWSFLALFFSSITHICCTLPIAKSIGHKQLHFFFKLCGFFQTFPPFHFFKPAKFVHLFAYYLINFVKFFHQYFQAHFVCAKFRLNFSIFDRFLFCFISPSPL